MCRLCEEGGGQYERRKRGRKAEMRTCEYGEGRAISGVTEYAVFEFVVFCVGFPSFRVVANAS